MLPSWALRYSLRGLNIGQVNLASKLECFAAAPRLRGFQNDRSEILLFAILSLLLLRIVLAVSHGPRILDSHFDESNSGRGTRCDNCFYKK
jgi:hypothetical protein